MTAPFTETLKQRFAGELSEGEKQICADIRDLLHRALTGQTGFRDAAKELWRIVSGLRASDYDVEEALASGVFGPGSPKPEAAMRDIEHAPTPLSGSEKAFLEDAGGLIDWVTRNGVSFEVVLLALGHDLSELARDDFDLEKMLRQRWVKPKVTGWAKRNTDPVGEADEQA